MHPYIQELQAAFQTEANPNNAIQQEAYMKNQYPFIGLSSPQRRALSKPFLIKSNWPEKSELTHLVKELWQMPQREFQYFCLDLQVKMLQLISEQDLALFEWQIQRKSWWDTIDVIAPKLMGHYFKKFLEKRKAAVDRYIASNNMWLQRAAILFQLKYKKEVDTELLAYILPQLMDTKEFFINKAIGWMLREYTRTNPQWVIEFVAQYESQLSNLSKKEALRLLH